MLSKILPKIILITTLIAVCWGHFPQFCSECEEELWEEVPCESITASTPYPAPAPTSTPATPVSPSPSSYPKVYPKPYIPPISTPTPPGKYPKVYPKPYIPPISTPAPPGTYPKVYPSPPSSTPAPPGSYPKVYPSPYVPPESTPAPTSTPSPSYDYTPSPPPNSTPGYTASTDAPDTYKKCYCECKLGCKEFCRKVTVDTDNKKQITQITQTSQQVPYGRLEVKHLHERKFSPSGYNIGSSYVGSVADYSNTGSIPSQLPSSPSSYASPCSSESSGEAYNTYSVPKPAPVYSSPPISNYYGDPMDSSAYSLDQLTKMLQAENYDKSYYENLTPAFYPAPSVSSSSYGKPSAPSNVKVPLYAPVYNTPASPAYPKIDSNYKSAGISSAAAAASATAGGSNSNYIAKSVNSGGTKVYSYKQSSDTVPTPYSNPELDLALDNYLNQYIYANSMGPNYGPALHPASTVY